MEIMKGFTQCEKGGFDSEVITITQKKSNELG